MAISWQFGGVFPFFGTWSHGKAHVEKPCSCCEDMNPDDALVDLRYCSEAKGMVWSQFWHRWFGMGGTLPIDIHSITYPYLRGFSCEL